MSSFGVSVTTFLGVDSHDLFPGERGMLCYAMFCVGGVAQWLVCRSLAGGLSVPCAPTYG